MANEFKVKKGLIVHGSGSAILDVRGSQGQLFSVTDSLSGSLFSVSDISGVPIMDVRSDAKIGIGTSTPAEKLHVYGGNVLISGSAANTTLKIEDGATGAPITLQSNGSGEAFIYIGGELSSIRRTGGDLNFFANSIDMKFSTNNGTTPTLFLDTNHSASFVGNIILDDGSGASPEVQFINQNDESWEIYNDSSGKLQIEQGGAGRVEFSSGGADFKTPVFVKNDSGLRINDTADSTTSRTTLTSFTNGGNSRMKIKGGNFIHTVAFETSKNNFEYAELISSYNGSDSSLRLKKSNSDTTGTAATTIISTGTSTFAGDVSMINGNATGKFAVKSTGVHGSYDFYNDGTSYFNGDVTIDANITQTTGTTATFSGDIILPASSRINFSTDIDVIHSTNTLKFVQGGSDRFSISGDVHVIGATDFAIPAGRKLYLDGQSNTYLTETSDGVIDFYGDGVQLLTAKQNGTQNEVVVNEGSGDVDFRVEANNESHAFFVEAEGTGKVGIGTDDPSATLHIKDVANSGVVTLSANDRIKLSGDGVITWGASANYGTLTWDTGKAVVSAQGSNRLHLATAGNSDALVLNGGRIGIAHSDPYNGTRVHIAGEDTSPTFNATAIDDTTLVLSNSDVAYGTVFGTFGTGDGVIQQRRMSSAVYYDLNLNPYGGNVGIGTTDPQDQLHVLSTLRVGPYFSSNDRDHIRLVPHGTDTRIQSPNERFHIENFVGNIIISASAVGGVGIANEGADVTAPSASLHVKSTTGDVLLVEGSGSTILDVQGSQGQLFSVSDQLTGSLFKVADISGIPVFEAFDDDRVIMGAYGQNTLYVKGSSGLGSGSVGINTAPSHLNVPLHVVGVGTSAANIRIGRDDGISTGKSITFVVSSTVDANIAADANKITLQPSSSQGGQFEFNKSGAVKFSTYGSGTHSGTAAKTLAVDSSGNVIEVSNSSGADNLGNHTATTNLNMSSNNINNVATMFGAAVTLTTAATSTGARRPFRSLHTSHNTIEIHQFGQSHADAPAVNQIGVSNAEQHLHLVTDAAATVASGSSTKGIFLRSGGNVGIGTNSPDELFHVFKPTSGDAGVKIETVSGGDPTIVFNSAAANRSGLIRFQDNGTNIGRIEYVHNGDKLQFQAGSATDYALQLENTTATFSGDLTVNGGDINLTKQNGSPIINLLRDGTNPGTNTLLHYLNFRVDYDGTHQDWGGIEHRTNASSVRTDLRINVKSSSGNVQTGIAVVGQPSDIPKVGIGLAAPTERLHVDGSGKFEGNVTITKSVGDTELLIEADTDNNNENDNPRLHLRQDGGAISAYFALNGDAGNTFTGALANSAHIRAAGAIQFAPGSSTLALTLDTSQNVGIGTNSPGSKLHLYRNDTGTSEILIENDGTGDSALTFRSDNSTDGNNFASMYFDANNEVNTNTRYAKIRAFIEDNEEDEEDGKLVFTTLTGGSDDNQLTLDSSGATFAGDVHLGGDTNSFAAKIYKKTVAINGSSLTTVATVAGNNLSSAIRLVATGTSGNVVIGCIADIIVNHSQDILIKTTNTFYRKLTIKIISNNNEDFAIQLKRDGDTTNDTNVQLEITPLNSEVVTFTNSHSFTGASLEHVSEYGTKLSSNDNNANYHDLYMQDNARLYFGDAPDFELKHNSTTNVNHISSKLDRQLSLNANIINLTNQANNDTVLTVSGSRVGVGTNSPGNKLQVKSSGADDGIYLVKSDSGNLLGGVIQTGTGDGALVARNTSNNQVVLLRGNGNNYINGGNLGLGTTSPNHKLDIQVDENVGLRLHRFNSALDTTEPIGIGFSHRSDTASSTTDTRAGIFSSYNGDLFFSVDQGGRVDDDPIADAAMFIDGAAGDVGIGTTSPNARLEIVSDGSAAGGAEIRLTHANNNSTDVVSTVNFANNVGSVAMIQGGTTSGNTNGYMAFFTDNSGTSSEKMRIISDGKVGIGTTSPGHLLEVRGTGDAVSVGNDTNNSTYIRFANTRAFVGYTGFNACLQAGSGKGIMFNVNNNTFNNGTAMFIKSDGNVGIGLTTPTEKLAVNGNIETSGNTAGLKIGFNVGDSFSFNSTTVAHYGVSNAGNVTAGGVVLSGYFGIRFASQGNIRGHISQAGLLTMANDVVAFGSPSDKSLKENIKPINNALDKVKNLKGVTFKWKEAGLTNLKEDIGFIAQDVQEVLPELVRENEDGKLSLRDKGIIPMLVEAVKELSAEVESLKKQLNK